MSRNAKTVAGLLANRTNNGELRMDAYYYGFTPTGVVEIDRILSAVACAGKAYHHTQDWSDETDDVIWDGDPNSVPKINEGVLPSWADIIQMAADEAALALRGSSNA